jgi:aminoglycoside phosphotransferase (APT) family kinase protein
MTNAEDGDRLAAMRAMVTPTLGISEVTVLQFLKSRPELKGREIRVTLESSDAKAGVSAGHVFFRLDDADDAAAQYRGRYVIRFDVGEQRLFLQTSIEHQFDVMRALHAHGFEVPDAVWFDRDSVIAPGAAALIMRRLDARPPQMLYMQQGPYVDASPSGRQAMMQSLMGFCVRLHAQPVNELGLDFLAKRGGEGEHFIDREINWIQHEFHTRFPVTEEGERAPLLSRMRRTCDGAAEWLRQRAPRHRKPVLVHGDVTFGNVMLNDDGSTAAVLDWELCHEGLPGEDVAWLSLAARSVVNFYGASANAMPTLEDTLKAYLSAGGKGEDVEYATALCAFQILSIGALAMRKMPQEYWPSQAELWDREEAMLSEAMGKFEHR